LEAEDGGTIGGMTAKQLVREHLPSWSEEQAQRALQAAEAEAKSERGAAGDAVLEDDSGPTFEERLAKLASFDFLPREDAWR